MISCAGHEELHDILAEAGRHKSSLRVGRKQPVDEMPEREPMRPRLNYISQGDNLGPLRRMLESRVGRAWDKVYSEICEAHPCGSIGREHVLSHVNGYVEQHPVMVDGVACHPVSYRYNYRHPVRWFYVDDRGILRKSKYKDSYVRPKDKHVIQIGERKVFVLDDGRMFEALPVPASVTGVCNKWLVRDRHNQPFRMVRGNRPQAAANYGNYSDVIGGPFKAVYDLDLGAA